MGMFKFSLLTGIGSIGAFFLSCFGGWDAALFALIVFMAVDYVTGLTVAGIFKASPKSACGGLESKAGIKGLVRKGTMLLLVLVATQLDVMLGSTFVRSALIIAFCVNETISIIENAGLMGIPIPEKLKQAISMLQDKGDNERV